MAVIKLYSTFGQVDAKPMRLVDLHDVQPMADEESINNSSVTEADKDSKASSESC